jgi:hypothetical protein
MSRVYGDSTPFPHDIDYIRLIRDGVDCAVRLCSAQHSIHAAVQRGEVAERAKQVEVAELNSLFEHVQNASTKSISDGLDCTVRTAAQIVANARGLVDTAIRDLESHVAVELGQTRHIVEKARETTSNALDQLLEQHAAPGSKLCLQLMAGPEANVGQVTVITPYGVSALFGVAIPPNHAWSRPRRVADFLPHLEIQMPKESGWLSKRVEKTAIRLERFFISDVMFSERSGLLRLRKGAGSGSGYQLRVDLEAGVNVSINPVREDGSVGEEQPLVLDGNDQATMLGLWKNVIGSSSDLINLRRRMVSAAFGDRPILELESPRALAEAIIAEMAPTVVEISRRSGAPGELVLRRNLGEGRREETYSTHTELLEKILVLPPDLRAVFAPLKLSGPAGAALPPVNGGSLQADARSSHEPPQRMSSPGVPGAVPSGTAQTGNGVPPGAVPNTSMSQARPPSVPPPA